MQIAHGDRRTMTSEQDRGPWSQRLTAPCTAERTLGGRLGRLSGKMPFCGMKVQPERCRGGWVFPRQMQYLASVLFSFSDIQLL